MASIPIQPFRTCRKCGAEKPATVQFFVKGRRQGLSDQCKSCRNLYLRAQRASNPERHRATNAAWNKANPERVRATTAAWAARNRERRRASQAKWAAANPGIPREWKRRKRRDDPQFRLHSSIGRQIRNYINGGKGGKRTEEILGYPIANLRLHLERQFLPGMNWGNYGEWHVDHILPVASFNFASPDDPDFKACWALTNLRPMWAADNIRKSDKRLYLI